MKNTQWKVVKQQGEFLYIEEEQGKKWNNPTICFLYQDVTPEDSVTLGAWLEHLPSAESNAHLIAAAPDLLSALQTLLTMEVKGHQLQDRLQFSTSGRQILDQCLSAIAKATNKEK